MKYNIGDHVLDEDGNEGVVVIRWNDGDICEYENDAAHPNPRIMCVVCHGLAGFHQAWCEKGGTGKRK